MARIQLAVWPDIPSDFELVDEEPDETAVEDVRAVFKRLSSLTVNEMGAERVNGGLPHLGFHPWAQGQFNEWLQQLERRIRSGDLSPVLAEHLSKYRALAPSLALVDHVVDQPDGGPVGAWSLGKAVKLCEFLERHAVRLYEPITPSSPTTDTASRISTYTPEVFVTIPARRTETAEGAAW